VSQENVNDDLPATHRWNTFGRGFPFKPGDHVCGDAWPNRAVIESLGYMTRLSKSADQEAADRAVIARILGEREAARAAALEAERADLKKKIAHESKRLSGIESAGRETPSLRSLLRAAETRVRAIDTELSK
jgi:hypothetical protein